VLWTRSDEKFNIKLEEPMDGQHEEGASGLDRQGKAGASWVWRKPPLLLPPATPSPSQLEASGWRSGTSAECNSGPKRCGGAIR
jgi:hypothetical protein